MFDFTFGDITVTRIVEMEMPMLGATTFFPEWNDAAIEPHRDWLIPRHFDPASGNVVINIQAFLVRTPRHTILVDTCVGNHKPRNREMFDNALFPWMDNFLALGVAPEDIDYVLSPESVLSTVDAIAPAMEIIDSRYKDFQFTLQDVIADNSSSSHFVLGDWRPATIDVSSLRMTLRIDEQPALTGYSHEISGHPMNSLIDLSALAVQHGVVLKAGWIILAGAATEAVPITGATKASCSVAGLGDVEVYVR